MSLTAETAAPLPPACPMHGALAQPGSGGSGFPRSVDTVEGLDPTDRLIFPLHRRVVTHYATDAATGARELQLLWGDKEISFDEPELFGFGETLAAQSRFVAGDAVRWGGEHDWIRVREMLLTLLDEGILQRDDRGSATGAASSAAGRVTDGGARPSPLPPAPCARPRFWDEGAPLLEALVGRPLEPGWLELVMPVFRVAHVALDAEGRQVGESNVFPKALRVDVPTRWRACIYPGTRHHAERPMNVSALKSMRAHWPQMMAVLRAVRTAFLRRFPDAGEGWTVGRLERLTVAVLAVPTWALVRGIAPVANGALHPALASVFRVTDGLRMVMHQMMFVPIGEPALSPQARVDARSILAYAERNYSFHSEHGVCAGPRAMIEEFLAVLLDGAGDGAPVALDPAVHAAIDDVDAAIDYGLHGLRVYAAMFSLWPAMARCYARLGQIAADAAAPNDRTRALQARLAEHVATLQTASYLGTEERCRAREHAYEDMYAACSAGLGLAGADGDLRARIAASQSHAHSAAAARALRHAFGRHLGVLREPPQSAAAGKALGNALADVALAFLMRLQAILAVACDAQRALNATLGRAQPRRPFAAADADIHNLLQADTERRLPYLVDELAALLGLRLQIDRDRIEIVELPPARRRPAGSAPNSTGIGPAEAACQTHAHLRREA